MKKQVSGFSLLSVLLFILIESFLMLLLVRNMLQFGYIYDHNKQLLLDQQRMRFAVYSIVNDIHHAKHISFNENGNFGTEIQLDHEKLYIQSTGRNDKKNKEILGLYRKIGTSPSEELVESISRMSVANIDHSSDGRQLITIELKIGALSWKMQVFFKPAKA